MQKQYIPFLKDSEKLIITKKAQKLSIVGKLRVFLYKAITGNTITPNAVFRPLKTRLNDLNQSNINHLTREELFRLKLQISSYLKYLKAEEKIEIVENLIIQIEKINTLLNENASKLNIDLENSNPPKTLNGEILITKKQKSVGQKGRVYTHVSVFEELSDYKEWLNLILKDANSASFTERNTHSSDNQFEMNLNVQQFAALFYFLQQEKILIIPEGKKREFAKTIITVFHTKGQKNVSVDSFVNKFSKPEIEAAEFWAIEFANLRMAAKKID